MSEFDSSDKIKDACMKQFLIHINFFINLIHLFYCSILYCTSDFAIMFSGKIRVGKKN